MKRAAAALLVVFILACSVAPTVHAYASVSARLAHAGFTVIEGGLARTGVSVVAGESLGAVSVAWHPAVLGTMLAASLLYSYKDEIGAWISGKPVLDDCGDNYDTTYCPNSKNYTWAVGEDGVPFFVSRSRLAPTVTIPTGAFPAITLHGYYDSDVLAETARQAWMDQLNEAASANGAASERWRSWANINFKPIDNVTGVQHSAYTAVYEKLVNNNWSSQRLYWFLANRNAYVDTNVPISEVHMDDIIGAAVQDSAHTAPTPLNQLPENVLVDEMGKLSDIINQNINTRSSPYASDAPELSGLEPLPKAAEEMWRNILESPEVQEWEDSLPAGDVVPVDPSTSPAGADKVWVLNGPALASSNHEAFQHEFDELKSKIGDKSDELRDRLDDSNEKLDGISTKLDDLPRRLGDELKADPPSPPVLPVFDASVEAIEKRSLPDLLDAIYGRFQSSALHSRLNVTLTADGSSGATGSASVGGVGWSLNYDLAPLQGVFASLGTVLLGLVAIRETYNLFK